MITTEWVKLLGYFWWYWHEHLCSLFLMFFLPFGFPESFIFKITLFSATICSGSSLS